MNSQLQLNAPQSQTVSGTTYTFGSWSDGGAATHVLNVPASNTTYTATYSGTCAPTTYASAIAADTPSYFWRLGETAGTAAADSSGNNRPGTYVNGVVLNQAGALTGDANRAVTLDGANDRVGRNPAAGITGTAITTDLWLKTTTTKAAGIVSYATTGSVGGVPPPEPEQLAGVREGHRVAGDRGEAERRAVAPPRGDLDVDRRCRTRLQGRRGSRSRARCGPGPR